MKKIQYVGLFIALSSVVPFGLAMLTVIGLEVPLKELAVTALVLIGIGLTLYKLAGGRFE